VGVFLETLRAENCQTSKKSYTDRVGSDRTCGPSHFAMAASTRAFVRRTIVLWAWWDGRIVVYASRVSPVLVVPAATTTTTYTSTASLTIFVCRFVRCAGVGAVEGGSSVQRNLIKVVCCTVTSQKSVWVGQRCERHIIEPHTCCVAGQQQPGRPKVGSDHHPRRAQSPRLACVNTHAHEREGGGGKEVRTATWQFWSACF
jgi:hypothetical protein